MLWFYVVIITNELWMSSCKISNCSYVNASASIFV